MGNLDPDRQEELLPRATTGGLRPEDIAIIRATLTSYCQLLQAAREEGMTVDRLRGLVFGRGTESAPAASDENHGRNHESEPEGP